MTINLPPASILQAEEIAEAARETAAAEIFDILAEGDERALEDACIGLVKSGRVEAIREAVRLLDGIERDHQRALAQALKSRALADLASHAVTTLWDAAEWEMRYGAGSGEMFHAVLIGSRESAEHARDRKATMRLNRLLTKHREAVPA